MGKHTATEDALARQRLALALLQAHTPAGKGSSVRRRTFFAVAAILAVTLVWAAAATYGMKYEVQGAVFAARNPDAQLEKLMQQKAREYRLRITRPDGVHQDFSLADMGMQLNADSSVAIARQKSGALKRRLTWWRPVPVQMTIGADAKALDAFIASHASIVIEPPRNASIALVDGTVQLTPGADGKQYGLADPMHTILEAASSLRTEPLHMKAIALQPAITTEALASTKAKLEAALKQTIIFTIGGQQVQPSPQDIAGWISITPHDDRVETAVNPDHVQAYLNQIAAGHSYPPKAQVSLYGGGVVPGVNGVTVNDTHSAKAAIMQELLSGKGFAIDLPTTVTPFETVTAASAGKWIEVDLSSKRLYAYSGADLVSTSLVSAGAAATPTVTGTFAIYTKYASQTMSGPNADGTRYVQPDVPWVNYFFQDYAIHGNYWRPVSYFGNIHSSHGCVGLLPTEAAWLYRWAPIGTPVVVHH